MSTPFYDLASLVVVPSGYKASKVYAQKPLTTDGQLAFSRASTATRVNASGLIETVSSNVPRLDYLGSTCPKLQLEPQRTNSVTFSEQTDNAAWTKSDTTITANAVTSPSGYQDADKLIANTTNASHFIQQNFTPSSATSYTLSTYAKAGEYNFIGLQIAFGGINAYASYNLSTGVVFQSGGGATATIQNAGNGWYRCFITATTISAAASVFNVRIENDGSLNNFVGNNVNGIYTWGCQLEAGAYATSYIPTLGAAVTRGADAASKTGISSLIGQTEGTLFLELDIVAGSPVYHTLMQAYGDDDNRIAIGQDLNSTNVFMYINGSGTSSYTVATVAAGPHKIALAYKNGDSVLYIDGAAVITTARAITLSTPLSTLFLNNLNGNEIGIFKDSQALLFPTRLSNADLAALTA